MTTIHIKTHIKSPIQKVFDLSRNINFHMISASKTNEKAIAGRVSGLIEFEETVTWKGKHFGVYLTHQSKITAFENPTYFVDEMILGNFKSFRHQHIFEETSTGTIMIDILEYQTPYGWAGKLFDMLMLKNHLTDFLLSRNKAIKQCSEQNK